MAISFYIRRCADKREKKGGGGKKKKKKDTSSKRLATKNFLSQKSGRRPPVEGGKRKGKEEAARAACRVKATMACAYDVRRGHRSTYAEHRGKREGKKRACIGLMRATTNVWRSV